jgi:hypothetical protein
MKIRSILEVLRNNRGEVNASSVVPKGEDVDPQDVLYKQAMDEIEAEKDGQQPDDKPATPPKKKDEGEESESEGNPDEGGDDGENEGGAKDTKDEKKPKEKADETPDDGDKGEEVDTDLDKEIQAYAEKHKLTYAEAKEDREKTAEILKQFKNDPAEMARAMRNKDREYHKLKTEQEKAAVKKEPIFKRMTDSQFIDWAKRTLKERPEDQKENEEYIHPEVMKFRQLYPTTAESLSDDQIIERIVAESLPKYHQKAAEKEGEIKTTASKKRDELISSVAEADRRFIPDVKAILLETDDEDVLSDKMDIKDALHWAKGKRYDADIKAAEERGAKRAKENPTIAGVKPSGQGSSGNTPKTGVALTDKQKKRAVEMYGNNYDDSECFKLYKETFEDEIKKDKNFV